MRRRLFIVAALLAVASPALAQQAAPIDEIQSQRNQFMAAFAQCDTGAIDLRHKLAAAEAHIKELEAAKPAEKKN